jgi:hypothetical protein
MIEQGRGLELDPPPSLGSIRGGPAARFYLGTLLPLPTAKLNFVTPFRYPLSLHLSVTEFRYMRGRPPSGQYAQTGAERIRALRARRKAVLSSAAGIDREPEPAAPQVEPTRVEIEPAAAAVSNPSPVLVRTPKISEDEYVALNMTADIRGKQRRARAEKYLRWRYQGYCLGEVATL